MQTKFWSENFKGRDQLGETQGYIRGKGKVVPLFV
jgi:hypothetical protein